MNNNYVPSGKAKKMLGVSLSTLIRWDKEGKLVPDRTPKGHRMYKISDIQSYNPLGLHKEPLKLKTIAYARVSSSDQKKDLERQAQVLEMYCSANGWSYELVKDLGSGMNYNKKGLQELLSQIIDGKIGRLVLTHKDRLLRFGAELIFSICEAKNVEVVIINQGDALKSYEEELASDIIEIITVFSARLYGSRSHKNKKIIENMQKAVSDVNKS
jgi:predicted site-specific integrase-resolvase